MKECQTPYSVLRLALHLSTVTRTTLAAIGTLLITAAFALHHIGVCATCRILHNEMEKRNKVSENTIALHLQTDKRLNSYKLLCRLSCILHRSHHKLSHHIGYFADRFFEHFLFVITKTTQYPCRQIPFLRFWSNA